MSHFSTDIIADQAIDQVANMPISQVRSQLISHNVNHFILVDDVARDKLIDIVFQQLMDGLIVPQASVAISKI